MRKNIQRQLHENALKPKHSNFFHKYVIFPHLRQPSDSQPYTPHSHTPSSFRLPRKAFSATRKSLFRTAKQPFPHHKTALSATKNSLFRNTKPPFPPTESKKMTHPNLFSQLSALPRTFRKTYFTKKTLSIFFTSVQCIFHSTKHFAHSAKRTIPHAKQTIPVMRASLSHHAIAFQYQRARHTTVTQKHHSGIAFNAPFLRKTKTSGNKKGTA